MYEIIPRATSEQNINTIHRSESNNSDDGLVNRPQHHQVRNQIQSKKKYFFLILSP
jgi:hypothetical protein